MPIGYSIQPPRSTNPDLSSTRIRSYVQSGGRDGAPQEDAKVEAARLRSLSKCESRLEFSAAQPVT